VEGDGDDGCKEEIVVGGVSDASPCDLDYLGVGQRAFTVGRAGAEFFAAGEGFDDKVVPPGVTDVGVEGFQLVADPGEVILD